MDKNSKQSKLVFGLIIVLVLVIFACLNIEPVAINFGFVQPKMPLIIVLVIMMLLGAVVSLLLGNGDKKRPSAKAITKQKAEIKKQYEQVIAEKDQKISELESEVDRLKKEKIQESSSDKQD